MIINTKERDTLQGVLADLERLAETMSPHATIRVTLYRNAAALRVILGRAVVTKSGRVDGHAC